MPNPKKLSRNECREYYQSMIQIMGINNNKDVNRFIMKATANFAVENKEKTHRKMKAVILNKIIEMKKKEFISITEADYYISRLKD